MAKAKSKNTTIDEALVSAEEQPYEVPGNWCWTKVKYVSEVVTGSTPSKKHEEYYGGSFPFFKPADLDAGDNVVDATEYLSDEGKAVSRIVPRLSTAVCCIGTIGKSGLLKVEGTTNQQINSMIPRINPLYVYYYSKTDEFVRELWDKSTSTTISMVNKSNMETNNIPLPPLAEQQRIVEQIENLFSKLDEAKEKAELSLESFDSRKEAILYKAFRGELTEHFRSHKNVEPASVYLNKLMDEEKTFSRNDFKFWENDRLPIGWVESKIGNLLYFAGRIGWKGLKAEEYTEEGPLFLSVYNLNDGDEVTYNRVYHITKERYEESPEIMVQVGDVLLTKDGAGIGKLGYVRELPEEATINSSLLLIRPGEVADSKYVFYLLSGPELQEIVRERITGSATPHLFQRDIKEFLIPIPPIEEQREIVSILDAILSKEYQAYEAAKMLIEQVDIMKKSILAKAFRGELGTNDPMEESSIELLKQILEA